MKNSQRKFRNGVVALVALSGVAFTNAAHATKTNGTVPVIVKCVGTANDAAIFQLSFTNEKNEQYDVTISDKFNTVYYEKIKGIEQVRKFQFYSSDTDGGSIDDELTVVIRNRTTKAVTTYKILPNVKVERETELVAVL
jgi:hypothetical protein